MANYTLSDRAEHDLEEIFEHSFVEFGLEQASRYYQGLKGVMELLGDSPAIGTRVDEARTGMLRHPHKRHVIYYRQRNGGVRIIRILHASMQPERHL